MTPRERVLAAWAFQQPDRLPYTLWYGDGVPERISAYLGSDAWRSQTVDHIFRGTLEFEPKKWTDETHYRDLYGGLWQTGNPLHLVEPPLKRPSLKGYEIPSLAEHVDLSEMRAKVLAAKRDRWTVVGYGFGIFERLWMLRGYENFCMDLFDEPAFVEDVLDRLTVTHLDLLDQMVQLPCDAIIFSDDFSDQRGVIVGPERWRALIKPRYEKLYRRVHEAGKMTMHHSCGCVAPIAGDLADIGLDILQSLQPEAMDVYSLKRLHGHRLRFWGGLGTQQLLPYGTPADVRAEVRRLAREMGRGGGYVFTSSKPIFAEVPLPNAVAVIETLLELHGEQIRRDR